MIMQKGYSVPIVIIAIVLFLLLPLTFWTLRNNFSFSSIPQNVKGVSIEGGGNLRPGFSVTISSKNGNWDFVEYLCKSLSECGQSLYSGVRWGVTSGGATENHEVVVENSDEWGKYSYVKYFVRPAWSSTQRNFRVISLGSYPDSKVYTLSDGSENVEAVIAKLIPGDTKFYTSSSFSDTF